MKGGDEVRLNVLKLSHLARPRTHEGANGEAAIREGAFADRWPATFPSGEGSDLAGIVEQAGPDVTTEDSMLRHGIVERGLGCPWVVAVHRGLVVIGGDVAPPAYGAQGYAVIDFNKAEPSLTRLAVG